MSGPRQSLLECTGHALVIGGPGSGKTTVALKKAYQRLSEGVLPGQKVMFLSFSRAAVFRVLAAAKKDADPLVSQIAVQTFHSFFWSLLQTHAYLLGSKRRLEIILPHDEKSLKAGLSDPEWFAEQQRLFREDGKIVFDLFALCTADLLNRSNAVRALVAEKYPMIVVDEAQDTGPEAWRCIELLSPLTQVICLADLDQQIFDHLPGIGPERVEAIKAALIPLEVDLGDDNNRSPGTDIYRFASDVLSGQVSQGSYRGVSLGTYNFNDPSTAVRRCIGRIYRSYRNEHGSLPNSVAFLAPYSKGVALITAALSDGDRPIVHKVLFDEAQVFLAARLGAFLLEPCSESQHLDGVATTLELLARMRRAVGSTAAIGDAQKLLIAAQKIRDGKQPKLKLERTVSDLLSRVREHQFSGTPGTDWSTLKAILRASGDAKISNVANQLDLLVAFGRGQRIANNLASVWSENGSYIGARVALDTAIVQDQLISDESDEGGIHVMTIHKSKGKQFDAVIILRESVRINEGFRSSFAWRDDIHPHRRSRKILRVGITRACKRLHILEPAFPCPIIQPFRSVLRDLP